MNSDSHFAAASKQSPGGAKVVRRTREEVLRLWVDALRSGKYRQTSGVLRDGHGFCCLGVLCDLARKDGGPRWKGGVYLDEESFLPKDIGTFMRIGLGEQQALAGKNDDLDSFASIADYIERKYIKSAAE